MNRKGEISMGVIFVMAMITLAFGALQNVPYRINAKCIDKCVSNGGEYEACSKEVLSWSEAQKVEYNRDSLSNPTVYQEKNIGKLSANGTLLGQIN